MLSSVYKWRLFFIASHPVFAVNNKQYNTISWWGNICSLQTDRAGGKLSRLTLNDIFLHPQPPIPFHKHQTKLTLQKWTTYFVSRENNKLLKKQLAHVSRTSCWLMPPVFSQPFGVLLWWTATNWRLSREHPSLDESPLELFSKDQWHDVSVNGLSDSGPLAFWRWRRFRWR